MAGNGSKRGASDSLESSAKRLRIDTSPPTLEAPIYDEEDDDDDEDEYQDHGDDSSGDERMAYTPNTPLSPGRKKFPSERKNIKCTVEGCNKMFNRPARLEAHLRSHTNERPFACTFEGCDKRYLEQKHLTQHIKGSHEKIKEYKCEWEGCDKTFLTATRLRRHEGIHKGHDRFRCTEYPPCNQAFRKHQTLQRHVCSEHLKLAPYPCLHVDPITSEPCTAGFDGPVGLRKHMQRVHGGAKFFCSECYVPGSFHEDGTPVNLGFISEKALQLHIRKEHPVCLYCDSNFSTQRGLQRHIEAKHSDTTVEERKNIPCTVMGCGKKFTTAYNLKHHISTAHEGARFICGTFDLSSISDITAFKNADGCGQPFTTKRALGDHVRTAHLGLPSIMNKPKIDMVSDVDTDDGEYYVPPNKKAIRKAKKEAKQMGVLDNTYAEDRKFACQYPECGRRYKRPHDLRYHLQNVHGMNDEVDASFMAGDRAVSGYNQEIPAMMNAANTFISPNADMGMTVGGFNMGNRLAMTIPGGLPPQYFDPEDLALQNAANAGGSFWVGGLPEIDNDSWALESRDMQRVVGRGGRRL